MKNAKEIRLPDCFPFTNPVEEEYDRLRVADAVCFLASKEDAEERFEEVLMVLERSSNFPRITIDSITDGFRTRS